METTINQHPGISIGLTCLWMTVLVLPTWGEENRFEPDDSGEEQPFEEGYKKWARRIHQEEPRKEDAPTGWSVTVFGGVHNKPRLYETITRLSMDFGDSYLGGIAVNKKVGHLREDIQFELEGSTYYHWGGQSLGEINFAMIGRWTGFPWREHVPTSIAFGSGQSIATERPAVEDETRKFLHHLLAEIEVKPSNSSAWSFVSRIHHRSGMFGAYGVSGGSNFLTMGLRFRW